MVASKTSEDRYFSPAQLAAYLNVGLRSVWRWVHDGTLPQPIRITDRVVRWRKSEVDSHLAARQGRTG